MRTRRVNLDAADPPSNGWSMGWLLALVGIALASEYFFPRRRPSRESWARIRSMVLWRRSLVGAGPPLKWKRPPTEAALPAQIYRIPDNQNIKSVSTHRADWTSRSEKKSFQVDRETAPQ